MKTIKEWTGHWDGKAGIEDPVTINGYCIGGVPISRERYMSAVVEPLLERLELAPHHRVLDVGCGTGMTLMEIEERVAEAVGTDFSKTMLEKYKGKAKTLVCAAHELPFTGEQFDRILMFSVAHYFPDFDYFQRVATRLLSLLRRSGILLIGDLPLGHRPAGSDYLWYDRHALVDYFDSFGLPYSIAAQSRAKRAINERYDILVFKD
jgi:SAM-dependent methyltransferase